MPHLCRALTKQGKIQTLLLRCRAINAVGNGPFSLPSSSFTAGVEVRAGLSIGGSVRVW